MTTQELLLEYQNLDGKPEEQKLLLANNQDNKRFISLIDLRESFITGFSKALDDRLQHLKNEETDKTK